MKNFDWNEFKKFNKIIFKYMIISFVLFVSVILVSELILRNNSEYVFNSLDALQNKFKSIDSPHKYMVFIKIFFNNLVACTVAIILGLIPFVFIPLLTCINNAYVMGLFIAGFNIMKRNTILIFIIGIMPHGIFEIPAIIYSVSIGLFLCKTNTFSIIKHESAKRYFKEIGDSFVLILIPLLLVAAFIEAYITPELMAMFIK